MKEENEAQGSSDLIHLHISGESMLRPILQALNVNTDIANTQ